MTTSSRIVSLGDCVAFRQECRVDHRRVVLTNGCFDIIHRGHLEYLERAAALGDALLVGINSDTSVRTLKGSDRPLNNEGDRAWAVASLRCVDRVMIFEGPRFTAEILAIKPDIYSKAADYSIATLDPDERSALQEVAAEIHILPFVPGHSTTGLLYRMRAGV